MANRGEIGVPDSAAAKAGQWHYALFAMSLAFAGIPIYIYAPDFYATQGNLALTGLGLSLLFLRGIDALLDPLMGWLGDRLPNHRLQLVIAGSVLMISGFSMLFAPLGLDSLIWFCISVFLATLGYSLASIQYNSLAALWSCRTLDQISITSRREALGIVGLVAAVMVIPLMEPLLGPRYAYLGLILALLLAAMISLPRLGLWYKANREALQIAQIQPGLEAGRLPMAFYLTYGISTLASAIPAVLVLFFVRDKLELGAWTGLFLALYFGSAFLAMPLWRWISVRRGHLYAWRVAMLVGILSFFWAFWLDSGDAWAYALICLASGSALGRRTFAASGVVERPYSPERGAGSNWRLFCTAVFSDQAGAGVSRRIGAAHAGAGRFVPAAENTAQALTALSLGYAALPCAIKLLALISTYFWHFTETEYDEQISAHRRHDCDYLPAD